MKDTSLENVGSDQMILISEMISCVFGAAIIADSDGLVVFANQAATNRLNLSAQDITQLVKVDLAESATSGKCSILIPSAENTPHLFQAERYCHFTSKGREYWLITLDKRVESTVAQRVFDGLSSELTSGKPLTEVLDSIISVVVRLAGADRAVITTLSSDRAAFEIVKEYPGNTSSRLIGERIPIDDHPTQIGLRDKKQPIIASDVRKHPIFLESKAVKTFTERLGSKSLIVVPMILRGQVIGTVSADYISREVEFGDEHVELLNRIADYSAIAIENAKLFGRNRALLQTQFLHDLSTPKAEEESLFKTAERILGEARSVVDFTTASLQVFGKQRRVLASFGFDKDKVSQRTLLSRDDDPLVKGILTEGNIRIIPDTLLDDRWVMQNETANVRSWIAIPFSPQDAPQFLITLDHDVPGFFGSLEQGVLERLKTFQLQARIELENYYLRRRVKSLSILKRFENISDISDTREALLRETARELHNAFKCAHSAIYLKTQEQPTLKLLCAHGDTCSISLASHFQDLAERAYRLGETQIVDDISSSIIRSEWSSMIRRGAIAAPICVGAEKIGVLLVDKHQGGAYSGADRFMLEVVAHRLGAALDRVARSQIVQKVSEEILGATSAESVLDSLGRGVAEMTRMDCVVYRLSKDKKSVIHKSLSSSSQLPDPRIAEGVGLTNELVLANRIIEVADTRADPRVNPNVTEKFRSITGLPLALEDNVMGVLFVKGQRLLTVGEKMFVTHLATLAGTVVQKIALLEDLNARQAHYESLLNNMRQCVTEKDREFKIVFANEAFCRSVERTLDELRGVTDFELYDEALASSYRRDDETVITSRQTITREEENRSPNGDLRWVKVVKSPIIDPVTDEVSGVHVVFWDITEEKNNRKRYESLVEQSPDGIVTHKQGIIQFANPGAVRLLGYESEQSLRGSHIHEFVHKEDRGLANAELQRILSGSDRQVVHELRFIKSADHCSEVVHVKASSRSGPMDGEVQVVLHDLTDVHRVLAEMHHRVKRVLNILQMQLEAYKKQDGSHVVEALQNRVMALSIAHGILFEDRSRGSIPMQRFLTDLVGAIQSAYSDGRHTIQIVSNIANVQLSEKCGTYCGLIISELVANSLLHAFDSEEFQGEATIWINLHLNGTEVKFEVIDNGSGCDPVALRKESSMGIDLVQGLVVDDLRGTIDFVCAPGFKAIGRFSFHQEDEINA